MSLRSNNKLSTLNFGYLTHSVLQETKYYSDNYQRCNMAYYVNWRGLFLMWRRGIKIHKKFVKANDLSLTPGKETGK